MQQATIILLGLAVIVYASARSTDKGLASRFQHLKGWHKIFGVLAMVLSMLIILNPELLALGFLADTALFDMLVLGLSLQMHTFAGRAFRSCVSMFSRGARWVGIPSPGGRYIWAVLTPVIAVVVTTSQKAVHRILS